jgi:hypothetical protein
LEFPYDGDVQRGLKILGTFAAAVMILLVVCVAVEHVRGRWALGRRLKDLEAHAEKLSVVAVEPKHPSADLNCFADLVKLTNRLSTVVTNIDPPPSLRFVAPSRAIVAWRLNEWRVERKTTGDWTGIAFTLVRERDLLAQLRAAVQKTAYDSGFDYRKGFVDFQIGQLATIKYAANLLSASALYNLHTNQIDGIRRSARFGPAHRQANARAARDRPIGLHRLRCDCLQCHVAGA